MMIPYCSFSALTSGNSPLLALQSHLPPCYLGSGALSYLKGVVWSWDLDLVISHKEMVCSSRLGQGAADLATSGLKSGRSLGDLSFCGPVRCLVRFHVITCWPCHLQVKHRTIVLTVISRCVCKRGPLSMRYVYIHTTLYIYIYMNEVFCVSLKS